jgi:ATP-dependent RNA helicase RhlE
MSFADLGLHPDLLRAIVDTGYTEPTPIQAQAIPVVLAGRDVMAGAQTGTGKTASFTLPMLHKLAAHQNTSTSPARHPVRGLILAPTRELAAQVEASVKTYSKHLALRSTSVYGGVNIDPQIAELRKGVEILVATPGRLLDHLHQKSVNLSQVEFLVLDEADRMLDMGFMPDIRRIFSFLPPRRQNLLFSATFSEDIKRLSSEFMRDPQLIEVARRNATSDNIQQVAYPVGGDHKRRLLAQIIKNENLHQVLVFTNTKTGANRLAHQLVHENINAVAIHSDKTQQARTQALADFKDGKIQALIGTDVAARGLDIDELPCVVNFDMPHNAEDYVHRIGRTGRAGATGKAVSLVAPEEKRYLADIEKLIKRNIPMEALPGYSAERYEAAPSQERFQDRSGERTGDRFGGRGRDRERSKPRPMREATVEAVQEKRPEIPALVEAPFTPRPGRKKEVAALLLRRGSTTTE